MMTDAHPPAIIQPAPAESGVQISGMIICRKHYVLVLRTFVAEHECRPLTKEDVVVGEKDSVTLTGGMILDDRGPGATGPALNFCGRMGSKTPSDQCPH